MKSIKKLNDGSFIMKWSTAGILDYKAQFFPKHKAFKVDFKRTDKNNWTRAIEIINNKCDNVIEFQEYINRNYR